LQQVDIALTPCGTYVVDILHSNSAEATAAIKYNPSILEQSNVLNQVTLASALRSMTLAISTTVLLPMINTYGYLFTNSLVSVFACVGFLCV
jgi:hypothetical protein